MELKLNDSVRVKQSVLDPDFNVDISGWQGRVLEICDEKIRQKHKQFHAG